jgi:hypothetical protein
MRQAGLKPKSHSSGTYWVRANAKTNPKVKKHDSELTSIHDVEFSTTFNVCNTILCTVLVLGLVGSLF